MPGAKGLSTNEGVSAVNISIYEIDRKVENAKITLEGEDILYQKFLEVVSKLGGVIHSVDEVVAGSVD